MKIELFFKTPAQLASVLQLIVSRPTLEPYRNFNIPNKLREENLIPYATQILDFIPDANVCLHYSLKNHKAKTLEDATNQFIEFVQESELVGIKEVLLVSGSGDKRKINSLSCIQKLDELNYRPPPNVKISVAFNPYYNNQVERDAERARLVEKLNSSIVSIVYLQFGTDVAMLDEGLQFLCSAVDVNNMKVYGSVFLPSKQLIARMKFRPWKGLLLSPDFLSSVESAEEVVNNMLDIYKGNNVIPIIETAFLTEKEATDMERLLRLDATTMRR